MVRSFSVSIRLEASASLLKSSSVPLTVFRTYANDDSKSILALTAVVPSATMGVVMCVVSVFPALVINDKNLLHTFNKKLSDRIRQLKKDEHHFLECYHRFVVTLPAGL